MRRRPATLADCALRAWPPALRSASYDTILLPLPADVAAWLADGGRVFLPDATAALPARGARSDRGSDSWSDEGGSAPSEAPAPPSLPAFAAAVDAALAALGGAALPKLDWSAPLDAGWLRPGGGARCACADEVLLLLKASDRAAHDVDALRELVQAHEAGGAREGGAGGDSPPPPPAPAPTPTPALRAWRPPRPGSEFRAFIVDGALVAVCQRDVTQSFAGLKGRRRALLPRVSAFVRAVLDPALPHLTDYVADVAVGSAGVRLVDVAPFGGATSALLFDWGDALLAAGAPGAGGEDASAAGSDASDAELTAGEASGGEGGGGGPRARTPFRVVGAAGRIAPGRSLYGAPHDMVSGEVVDALVDRLRAARAEG